MEKKNEFLIENNDCKDLDELINLSKTYYSDCDVVNKSYLSWQYFSNPAGKPLLITSREKLSKELAGQYLVIPMKYNYNGKPILGSLSLNTLTSPKYQRNGLFVKMANATYKSCEDEQIFFTTGFPNPNSYPGFVKKLNFTHLGDLPLLIKPLKFFSIISTYFKRNQKKHGNTIELKAILNENIKEFDFGCDDLKSKYTQFWDKIKKQYQLSSEKDYAFLKWRYFEIPTREYKTYYYEENNVIKGIAVIKAGEVMGFNAAILMDIMFFEKTPSIGNLLINFISSVSKNANLDFIATLHSKSYEYNTLKKNGFYKLPEKILPQKIHFIVRGNIKFNNSSALIDESNWKLTFGDYDVF
jgi:hypothetical protein